jgi:hypothetical protein
MKCEPTGVCNVRSESKMLKILEPVRKSTTLEKMPTCIDDTHPGIWLPQCRVLSASVRPFLVDSCSPQVEHSNGLWTEDVLIQILQATSAYIFYEPI